MKEWLVKQAAPAAARLAVSVALTVAVSAGVLSAACKADVERVLAPLLAVIASRQ